ncbi:MAG TPA: 4Fe-4S binding protein [bacterium]|nr:4Fe-4S binding protein [bacterium]
MTFTAAFFVTAALLAIVQLIVRSPMLLADRFFPTFGWLEILALALYAGWITEKMLDPKQTAKWRLRIWMLFSIVFFSQLIIGVLGVERLLMTGKLHLPVPAMIVAGPLYRAQGFFMPILFVVTLLFIGPAWCSHLCYVGAWDNFAANIQKRVGSLPNWHHAMRMGILALVVLAALTLRLTGVGWLTATLLGASFGILGVGIMVTLSRKTGVMVHCVSYCPIGLLANWIGKLNPFRIRIQNGCNECGFCTRVCRYDALRTADIKKRKVGLTCTLCGDCIRSCHGGWLQYRFLKMEPDSARRMFIVIAVSLHAVFLGLARI